MFVPPFATVSVPVMLESVDVATQAGLPSLRVRINPLVEDATFVSTVGEEAYKISPDVYDDWPVPPFPPVSAVISVRTPAESNDEVAVPPK